MDSKQQTAEATLKQAIGRRLRQARESRVPKMSQAELAKVLGVSAQQVQKYESGRDEIGISRLLVMVEVLGWKVGALLGE